MAKHALIVFQERQTSGVTAQQWAASLNHLGTADWTAFQITSNGGLATSGPRMCPDGAGGFITAFVDDRTGTDDLYAQRIDLNGNPLWTTGGVVISTATNAQRNLMMIGDGLGGAFIVWEDFRVSSLNAGIYAQYINASGAVQWTANGLAIATTATTEFSVDICTDGGTGCIIAWQEGNSGAASRVKLQKLNASGTAQWTAGGVAASTGSSYDANIITDGSGGVVVFFTESGNFLHAQRLNSAGTVQWGATGTVINAFGNMGPTLGSDRRIVQVGADWCVLHSQGGRATMGGVTSTGTTLFGAVNLTSAMSPNLGSNPQTLISDGSGGMIACFGHTSSGGVNNRVVIQRLSSIGVPQWTKVLADRSTQVVTPRICSDGDGGCVVIWGEGTGTNFSYYVERIDPSGSAMWAANGTVLHGTSGFSSGSMNAYIEQGNVSVSIPTTPAAADSRAGLENNIRLLIDDRDKDSYTISGPRMIQLMNECLHLLANRLILEDEAIASVSLVAGTYDYTLSGTPTAIHGVFLSSFGVELDRMEMDELNRLYRQDTAIPAGSGIPAFYAVHETSAQATKIRVAPTPSSAGATTLKVRTSVVPSELTAETSTVPFSDPILRAFERMVAAECVALMSESEKIRRMIDRDTVRGWIEYVDQAVKDENWRMRVQSGSTQFDLAWTEV